MARYPKLIRKPSILERFPISSTTLYKQMSQGIFPPNIPLGGRSVGWIELEVDTVIAAIVQGSNGAALKQLVAELVAKRNELYRT